MTAAGKVMNFVVAAVALPPPLHGQSLVNKAITDRLRHKTPIAVVDLSPGSLNRDIFYHLRRLWMALYTAAVLVFHASRHRKTFYTVVEAGAGMTYTVFLTSIAKRLGYQLFLHHHASNYLLHFAPIFDRLARNTGSETVHIVGSELMARDLRSTYPTVKAITISTNVCHIEAGQFSKFRPRSAQSLKIGFLSNLTMEKGLGRAIAVASRLKATGASVDLILAGPLIEDEARHAFEAARPMLGDNLSYLGPVIGSAKADFFNSIDIFLFPTTYRHETHGLVVFEAMSYGVPVIVNDTGYTAEFARGSGIVVAPGEDFVERSVDTISYWATHRDELAAQSAVSRQAYERLRADSEKQYERLVDSICGDRN